MTANSLPAFTHLKWVGSTKIEISRLKRLAAIVVALLGMATTLLYWFGGERRAAVDVSEVAGRAPEPEARSSAGSGIAKGVEARPADAGGPPLRRAVNEHSVGPLPFFTEERLPVGRALVRVAGASAAAQGWQAGITIHFRLTSTESVQPRQTGCDNCPEMVTLPSGSFEMGCVVDDGDCYYNENPAHRVNIQKSFGFVTRSDICTMGGVPGRRRVWSLYPE